MAGTSRLRCRGFIEAETLAGSIAILKAELAERGETISEAAIEDRLEAMQWALNRGDRENVAPVGTRTLWVYVIPEGYPPLRVFLRPRPEIPDECEILWIEERL
jgi:hypothetical protein